MAQRGLPILIDPTRISTDKPALYVFLKGEPFYYKSVEELLKKLKTDVGRKDPSLLMPKTPVVTNAAKAIGSESLAKPTRTPGKSILSRFSGATAPRPTTAPARKGSVANTLRNKRPNAPKEPSRFSTYLASATGTTRKIGSTVASAAKRTGSAASSAFSRPKGYQRVLDPNVNVPKQNPFTTKAPVGNNLSENNPFKNASNTASKTKPVPLPTAKKSGMFQTLKNKTRGLGSGLAYAVGELTRGPGLLSAF